MSSFQKIKDMLPELSKNERKVAEHVLKYPYDLQRLSGEAMALTCGVSRSALIRFCHKMGFAGYADLRLALIDESYTYQDDSSQASNYVLDIYQKCIQSLDQGIEREELGKVADILMHADRIVSAGLLHSGMSAEQFAFRLNREKIGCTAVNDLTILSNYASILQKGDVLVIFSLSGQSAYTEVTDALRKAGVYVILVTMSSGSRLCKHVDHVLLCPTAIHSASKHLMDDAICFFLMIELIIDEIAMKRLKKSQDKASQHK